ncbi:MAG: polysaccharide export protein [Microscillaceae bacterium]|nr:polysaccharide export protein [Microscillaceae bacterium]
MRLSIILLAFSFLLSSACVSNKRRVYLQGLGYEGSNSIFIANPLQTYRLQVNDMLSVIIKSSDEDAAKPYNLQTGAQVGVGLQGLFLPGYQIDALGNIAIPVLGNIQVRGKTLEEAKSLIETLIAKYLKDATVDVKFVNYRVAVFGEVNRPGLLNVAGNQISIFQALASAGDLTDFANRQSIKLIRQQEGGLEVIPIDLTKKDILTSPYYYLNPNDQLYVEPLRADSRRANLPLLTVVFSSISTTVLLLNFLTR